MTTKLPTSSGMIKNRKHRACDVCRRKRIKCDGSGGRGEPSTCSSCLLFKTACTFNDTMKKSGPNKGYIRVLEARVAKLENMLREGGHDFTREVEDGAAQAESILRDSSITKLNYESPDSDADSSSGEELLQVALIDKLEDLSLNPVQRRYLQKSGSMRLVKSAISMAGGQPGNSTGSGALASSLDALRRKEIWNLPPWELSIFEEEYPVFEFPQPDLLQTLIVQYFNCVNCLTPILHRPTFEANVQQGLQYKDPWFAAVLLVVCAIASRHTKDRRALYPGSTSLRSSGWHWFNQVLKVRRSPFVSTTLCGLQLQCLCAAFLMGSSVPHAAWTAIGQGLRMAQDIGAHKRRFYGDRISLAGELWKRAFWYLVDAERGFGIALGRAHTLDDDQIEIDYPMECDDECWTSFELSLPPQQPADRPSVMTFFHLILRKSKITADFIPVVYSNRSSCSAKQPDRQRLVEKLDSELNHWFNSIPLHLRWPQHHSNAITFRQAAVLNLIYYKTQILMHRPFISFAPSPSSFSSSCTAICISASRSLIGIADVYLQKCETMHENSVVVFPACMVLLLQALSLKRSGRSVDESRVAGEVRKGINVLETLSERFRLAGVFA
ncbi:hypothetical protein OE88DRAFT_1661464 [Heliocybe sulcata]|uniref:Zn(2)-C6 fungal-type domain-containing protein n=1 Tax=Heliocybe sulcata TaxID=5364 RepID=A0A5C3MWT3_9AGAM|nr:hypothetical protein OE88DRAFT_1661464 [Heliocybe sulcata]